MGVSHLGEVGLKQEIALIWRAIRRISKATLQNSSIGRAVLRFYAGGRIRIEDGGGIEILDGGYIVMDGDITGDGDFDWTGSFKARGPWELIGLGKVTAAVVEWTGRFDLTGDIVVLAGGTIKAGNIEITPSANGGTVRLGSSEIYGSDGGIMLNPGSGASIITSAAGVRIAFLPTITEASSGLPAGTIHVDALGYLRRVV